MDNSFLKTLHCPFCGFTLVVSDRFLEIEGRMIHGVVSCQCAKYPILSGVLMLSKDKTRLRALEFLTKEKKKLKSFTEIPFFLLNLPVGSRGSLLILSIFSNINPFKNLTFSRLIHILVFLRVINSQWANYLLNRFREKIFYPATISATLVKLGSKVLDAGCGAGHLLNLLEGFTRVRNLCGVDFDLLNLYMSKKYFCKDANYIYLDLNYPLPFAEFSFQNIFCNDVFHYVGNQKHLGNEFKRIMKINGLIILNHLHNRTFSNYFDNPNEYSDNPLGYASSFPGFIFSLFSEELTHRGKLKYIKKEDIESQTKKLRTFTLVVYSKTVEQRFMRDIQVDLRLSKLPKKYQKQK